MSEAIWAAALAVTAADMLALAKATAQAKAQVGTITIAADLAAVVVTAVEAVTSTIRVAAEDIRAEEATPVAEHTVVQAAIQTSSRVVAQVIIRWAEAAEVECINSRIAVII